MDDGKTICILHGLLGRGGEWADVAARLPIPAITPDLLGHGDAPELTAGPVWPQYLAQLDAVLPAHPVDLAGHSMGGILALKYAAARPDRVARVILIESGVHASTEHTNAALAHWITHAWPSQFKTRADAAQFFADCDLHPAWIANLTDDLRPQFDPRSCARAITELNAQDRLGDLISLRCPVHVIIAENSLLEDADLAAMRAHPALHGPQIIAQTGHDVHLDHPLRTARALQRACTPLRIRPERPEDVDAIDALTRAAFAPMEHSRGAEPGIIRALRADGALSLSLVARDCGDLIGHVAFSPLTIDGSDAPWCALGPISVRADRQGEGVASELVAKGLAQMRARGMAGCALIGNPAVYGPMGFHSCGRLTYGGLDPALVQHIRFDGPVPQGALRFHPAFDE